jgi:hypothetical protein
MEVKLHGSAYGTKQRSDLSKVPVHAMKAYGRPEIQLQSFLTSPQDGGEGRPLPPGRYHRGKNTQLNKSNNTWQQICVSLIASASTHVCGNAYRMIHEKKVNNFEGDSIGIVRK